MNLIETTAPISIENLKKFFTDKSTFFVINYKESSLQGTKLLTYLSNLDIPCDIDFSGCDADECYSMLKDYLTTTMIVNIPSLEWFTLDILSQAKSLKPPTDKKFIEENQQIINKWISKLDSMTLYNLHTIKEQKFESFISQFPVDDTDELSGVNFVSLLKRPELYELFININKENVKFYSHYFNDYMFKGKSLFSYWANDNNPLFLLTYGISEGIISPDEYNKAKMQTIKGLENATSV